MTPSSPKFVSNPAAAPQPEPLQQARWRPGVRRRSPGQRAGAVRPSETSSARLSTSGSPRRSTVETFAPGASH